MKLNVTAIGALTLGNITSGGATSLGAGGAIVVLSGDGIVSGAALTVTQGASLTMGANSFLSAVKQVDVTVSGAALLGQLRSTLNADHAVTLHAGTISGNGDGQTNIVARGPLARSYLAAASGIGSSTRPIVVDTPWLNPTTTAGDIYLAARSSLIVPNIVAPGVFSLNGSGALNGGSITTTGNTTLSAAGAIAFTDITSGKTTIITAGDAITVHNVASPTGIGINAGKDISFSLLTSSGGNVLANSSGGAINGGSVVAAGSVTLTAAGAVTFANINAGQGILIVPSAGLVANAVGTRDVSITSLTDCTTCAMFTTFGARRDSVETSFQSLDCNCSVASAVVSSRCRSIPAAYCV